MNDDKINWKENDNLKLVSVFLSRLSGKPKPKFSSLFRVYVNICKYNDRTEHFCYFKTKKIPNISTNWKLQFPSYQLMVIKKVENKTVILKRHTVNKVNKQHFDP